MYKITVSEVVAIPARLEILIQGKIQAKDISQVGMISAGHVDIVLDIYKDYTWPIWLYPCR